MAELLLPQVVAEPSGRQALALLDEIGPPAAFAAVADRLLAEDASFAGTVEQDEEWQATLRRLAARLG